MIAVLTALIQKQSGSRTMIRLILPVALGLAMIAPAAAQDWGSGYNMGSIGVTGGSAGTGEIMIDCAESGNPVVAQGSLSMFIKPASDAKAKSGNFSFAVDGEAVTLPVGADQGDGFVYDKTPETVADAVRLIDLLKGGRELVVSAGDAEIARIGLDGAAAALEGVEVCL
jgi:hypothetical protein